MILLPTNDSYSDSSVLLCELINVADSSNHCIWLTLMMIDDRPLELKSSTRMISWMRCFGERFSTLTAERSSVDQCSLWNGITTLTLGSFARYFLCLQLTHTHTDTTELPCWRWEVSPGTSCAYNWHIHTDTTELPRSRWEVYQTDKGTCSETYYCWLITSYFSCCASCYVSLQRSMKVNICQVKVYHTHRQTNRETDKQTDRERLTLDVWCPVVIYPVRSCHWQMR